MPPSDIDLDFQLPTGDIPPNRPHQISLEAWFRWCEEYRREMLRDGRMEQRRNDPQHCPVGEPFVWHDDAPANGGEKAPATS